MFLHKFNPQTGVDVLRLGKRKGQAESGHDKAGQAESSRNKNGLSG
jgi:hypothetical protein